MSKNQKRTLRDIRRRNILYKAYNGKCGICGKHLPDNWEADHIIPYSKTGRTNLFEMQPTCPECNRKKGAK